MASGSIPESDKILTQLTEESVRRTPAAVVSHVGILTLLTTMAVRSPGSPPPPFWLFASGILLFALIRLRLSLTKHSLGPKAVASATLALAVSWAGLAITIFHNDGVLSPAGVVACISLAGLAAGANLSLGPLPRLYRGFTGLTLGVPSLYLVFTQFGRPEAWIGVSGLVFLLYVFKQGTSHHWMLTEIFRDRELSRTKTLLVSQILDTIPGLVSCIDQNDRYIAVNSALSARFGLAPGDFIGRPVGFLRKDDELIRVIEEFKRSNLTQLKQSLALPPSGGEEKWHQVSLGRTLDSSVDLTVCVSLDIQEQIDSRAKAESALRLAGLGELAAGIAHEINNPLTILTYHLELLRADLSRKSPLPDAELESLSRMETTVARIARIVRLMRTLSSTSEKDERVRVSLRAIIQDSLGMLTHRVRDEAVEVRNLLSEELLDTSIECQPTQLSQVVINLLNNAIEATRPLKSRWIELSGSVQGGSLRLEITDSGAGIPEPIASRIMEPFFTTRSTGKGTGLGLSIARKIARNHNGDLILDRRSKNTRFVLSVPLLSQVVPAKDSTELLVDRAAS